MAAGGYFGVETIQHVDGGLFNDDAVLLMDGDSLRTLAEVSSQDWGAIEPAIFGTLFERGLDPGKRSQQGAHFTSKEDILLIVEPVLMAPLRRRWDEVRAEAQALAAELAQIDAGIESDKSAAAVAKRRTARTKTRNKLTELLLAFRQELAAIQVLDPASGSGNFLYVALRLLLDLEKEVISLDASLGGTFSFPMVSPEPVARDRDQPVRARAGAGDDLDRLHPVAARQRARAAGRADLEAAGCDQADGRDAGV